MTALHRAAEGSGVRNDQAPATVEWGTDGLDHPHFRFSVFVAGDAERGHAAGTTLERLCREHLRDGGYEIAIVDVIANPEKAREHQVLATPTVIRHEPGPEIRFLGDLSRVDNAGRLLGIF
ncbi:MAG TPA: circadian clock KaiB family protein [Acidimicrobiales bacterium]|jgi:circadian clock protein KaiB